jgi:GT2 family glycosyltransferase
MNPSERCKVVIGIPTLNGPERLERSLKALVKGTPFDKLAAKAVICDDGSRPELLKRNIEIAAQYEMEILSNDARLGVSESWNRMARHGVRSWGADCVVLLNDDVEVVPDWLEALVFSVRMNEHAGMVGLNAWQGVNTDCFVQPPTLTYNEAIMLHGYGMLASCGYCFAFSAEKFEAVGGFDPRYFCFYEEVDFGVAFLHGGWPSYMLSYPFVIHQGGATTSDPTNINAAERLAESRNKFNEKWTGIASQRELFREKKWPSCVNWNTALRNLED